MRNRDSLKGILIAGGNKRDDQFQGVNSMNFSPSKMHRGPTPANSTEKFKFGMSPEKAPRGLTTLKNYNQQLDHMNNSKSPFKTMVKQQPIEADASVVPMETETNVKDEEEKNVF